eukprot:86982-Lingulodinium_polyedra.AAC.1
MDIFVAAVVVLPSPRARRPVAPGCPCADQRARISACIAREGAVHEWRIVFYSPKRPSSGA